LMYRETTHIYGSVDGIVDPQPLTSKYVACHAR
jgi:hypothetical protein